jgi:hypothetical protein
MYNRRDSAEFLRAIADGIEKGDYPVVVKAALVLNYDDEGKRISVFVFGSECNGNHDGLALMVLGQQALCDQILGA